MSRQGHAFARIICALLVLPAVPVVLLVLPGSAGAQGVEADIAEVRERLEAARAAHLDLVAPREFGRAASRLEEAQERLARGGKLDEIRKRVDEARRALTAAEQLEEVGTLLLRTAIEARGDALASNAPEFASELWAAAERKMREAGEGVEDGDQNDARRKGAEAAAKYRDAELQAIRVDVLGTARELRAQAVGGDADELAATTLATADRLLAEAESVLKDDRYDRGEARRMAEQAAEEFRHAARIAAEVKALEEDRKRATEELILRYEEQVARIAGGLGFEPRFSGGVTAVADQIVAAIASLTEDRDDLVQKVASCNERIAELEDRLGSLEARDAELQQREQRERTLRDVRGLFTPAEAEVLLRGEQLLVRLYGLSFPSGSSEIRPENFSLLTKVQRVLRQFPKAPVAIEGHTDSRGDESYNQELSQRRANAVREYILANMNIDGEYVMAIGYGEGKPIANNETADGRAKNRRIDVVIDMIGG